MSKAPCILVVDDHAVVRRGTMEIISSLLPDCHFREAQTQAQALLQMRDGPFDLAVLDISLPDGSGLELLQSLHRQAPDMPILIFSMHQEAEYARKALALGASGYLGKNSAPEELTEALKTLLAGQNYVSPGLTGCVRASDNPAQESWHGLSRREREVMYQLAMGKTVSDIAALMGVSVKTTSTYRRRIMNKLGLQTTADFFRYVLKRKDIFS